MKQKKFGKKVQNWHRPLGADEKNAKFLRNQFQDPIYNDDGTHRGNVHESFPDYQEDIDYDDFWNKYDPHDPFIVYYSDQNERLSWWNESYERELYDDAESVDVRQFKNWIEETALPSDLELKVSQVFSRDVVNDYSTIQTIAPEPEDFDQELLALSEFEDYFKDKDGVLFNKIRLATGDRENIRVIYNQFPGFEHVEIRYNLILFAPFWVRLPVHWDPSGEVNLVEHLFCIYKAPRFLIPEWFRSDVRFRKKWILWFILLGQGVSLQKAAKKFDWKIPKKFTHYLFELPDGISPMLACIYAKIRCMGGTQWAFEHLILDDFYLMDPTEFNMSYDPHLFWLESVNWLISHNEQMTGEECNRVLLWGTHRFTESRYQENKFTWKGRSVQQSLARANEYHESLKKYYKPRNWNAKGWNWSHEDEEGSSWKIEEIIDSQSLFMEGQYMRHCVYGYESRCVSGQSAIFSMTKDDKRKVTIEIQPETRRIVQAHGISNRMPHPNEKAIVKSWIAYLEELPGKD